MKDSHRAQRARYRSVCAVTGALALCASAAAIAQSQSHPQGLAIPAFFPIDDQVDAGNPHSREDWHELLDGGSVARIVVLEKDTIGTGSGVSGDCTGSAADLINCLHANGSLVLGYVNTEFGCRSIADVENGTAETDAGVAAWSSLNIDGIFFDNAAPDPSHVPACTFSVANYRALSSFVHATAWNGAGPDLCNGHACVMMNSSQYENDDLLAGGTAAENADFSTTYEHPVSEKQFVAKCIPGAGPDAGDEQGYFGPTVDDPRGFCPNTGVADGDAGTPLCGATMNPANWYFADLASRTAHVLREDADQAPFHAVADVIAQSQSDHAGFVYLNDALCDAANGSQYDHLTRYYGALLSTLGASLNIDRITGSTGTGKVTSAGNGINCDESPTEKCKNLIPKGTTLTLTAQPDPDGSRFAGFFDGTTQICNANNENPPPTTCQLTLTTDETVVTKFAKDSTLTVTNDPIGGDGTVTSSDGRINCVSTCTFNCDVTCSATYTSPATVTMTAAATSGVFTRWLGACTGSSPTCQVSMASPQSVTAQFGAPPVPPQCSASTTPCCPGDPCRPAGSSCLGVVCGGSN